MATHLLDALNDKKNRNRSLVTLAEQGHTLACCPINVAEVYAGLRPKEEQRTAALLRSLQLYPITFPIAELAASSATTAAEGKR
jgi:predicted nucleic acid-binding protein